MACAISLSFKLERTKSVHRLLARGFVYGPMRVSITIVILPWQYIWQLCRIGSKNLGIVSIILICKDCVRMFFTSSTSLFLSCKSLFIWSNEIVINIVIGFFSFLSNPRNNRSSSRSSHFTFSEKSWKGSKVSSVSYPIRRLLRSEKWDRA